MATLHRSNPGGGQVIYLKGAPETILRRCELVGPGRPLDETEVHERVEAMAGRGLRVLAVAERRPPLPLAELSDADLEHGFSLLGLQGMIDPPRPEALEAIRACRRAGIVVHMITGDHLGTARAIGDQLGLLDDAGSALTGAELAGQSDEQLRATAVRARVFARVSRGSPRSTSCGWCARCRPTATWWR